MKLAVITDVHANLPALRAALAAIENEGCDEIIHTGDAIDIGPFPGECLEILLSLKNISFVMGNHDAQFVEGIQPWMNERLGPDHIEHRHWTHSRIRPALRKAVAAWPIRLERTLGRTKLSFIHYGLDESGNDFAPVIPQPTPEAMDRLFKVEKADIIFHGHSHFFSDLSGVSRYVNPGALGCHDRPAARFAFVEERSGTVSVSFREALYEDHELFEAFEREKVPAREFIYRTFMGGRFVPA
ncbi:MAG: metallophosphoesterase family protein [Spirochaetia bacterium]|nr:metallophosphoesterase family protein [Spirochaetia bacterium]